MNRIITGSNAFIAGASNVAVFAEMVSRVNYEMLEKSQGERSLTVSREQFEQFIASQVESLTQAGLLDEQMLPTGVVNVPLQ